ncbi:Uncharacterized protein dnm_087410 [Desulfonema magnum]|uniref:Uncharacterized protein n=1 Tax=Desulfonema magnum TaxID=45655 RepID=A0A975GT30_9BACT|nr:Uncharacterized protein dnm_087410 [Desulfonema magnum]
MSETELFSLIRNLSDIVPTLYARMQPKNNYRDVLVNGKQSYYFRSRGKMSEKLIAVLPLPSKDVKILIISDKYSARWVSVPPILTF